MNKTNKYKIAKQKGKAVANDLMNTTLRRSEVLAKHHIGPAVLAVIVEEYGIDMAARGRKLKSRSRVSSRAKDEANLVRDMLKTETPFRDLLVKHRIGERRGRALMKEAGINPDERLKRIKRKNAVGASGSGKNDRIAEAMAGEFSLHYLTVPFVRNPPATWNYWGCGV